MTQRLSAVFEMPPLAEPGHVVSEAEVDFFRREGFLVKRGLLDPPKLAAAMDRIWLHTLANVPAREGSGWTLSREDPATWVNPQWARMPPHPESGPHQGRQPIEYYGGTLKLHDIGDARYLLDLLPDEPRVLAVAHALLGKDLRPSHRTRGVYALFPTEEAASLLPHTDQVCQQLNACAYLEDVKPGNGGFTVYPGSHELVFRAHRYESNWSPLPSLRDVLRRVAEQIEPCEIVAEKGSVIFWHGRMVHSSGIHLGPDIRWALFADFTQEREVLSDEEHRRVGQFEWFKNAKLFRNDWPVGADLWRHWNIGRARP